ncbi:hypothetical protein OCV58_12010 [Megasphaera butyrica]|uniref:hypothetical protein n=1 Tax=Megasphaera butyrica TaxID=2981791 RepID=UPI000823255E|nr:hypothetical protein [Megasphaera butyrica]MCU6715622.1 hypothetical protein [Megasphaera butyrica]SCI17453.1 Uncharacterised protein [uncultured Megasphaera sp.]SCJ70231.1 Uncharacterised protein [uncultured Ruminococcus sp.]
MKAKKIFLIFFLIICPLNFSFANYFDNYPDRFLCYDSSIRFKSYLDLNSVKVIRYDPPYYAIQVDRYSFDYELHAGLKTVNIYFYDYNSQIISWQVIGMFECDENGNLGKGGMLSKSYNAVYLKDFSPGYLAASLTFMQAYKMPFHHSSKRK